MFDDLKVKLGLKVGLKDPDMNLNLDLQVVPAVIPVVLLPLNCRVVKDAELFESLVK